MVMNGKNEVHQVKSTGFSEKQIQEKRKQGEQEEEKAREPNTEEGIEKLFFISSFDRHRTIYPAKKQKKQDADENKHPKRGYVPDPSACHVFICQKTGLEEQRASASKDQ